MKIYFKHSNKCPISLRAQREMNRYLELKASHIQYELIDVIGDKERSNEIASIYKINHESPQVILTNGNNQVIWTASHNKITEKNLIEAVEKNKI